MGRYTRYLMVHEESRDHFRVAVTADTPLPAITAALQHAADLRYSPILPAYLTPGEEPPLPSTPLESVAFFFARSPYQALGQLKPTLAQGERERVFFTQGLASILMLNCDADRARSIKQDGECSQCEVWSLKDDILTTSNITYLHDAAGPAEGMPFDLVSTGLPELDVYVEQLSASITSLWAFYSLHWPDERLTLTRILEFAKRLLQQYVALASGTATMTTLKQQNAVIAALVELSAALSYSVTQGASGVSPILANRSPFPHHSLLGVGGAIRALTKFTRYLEAVFETRSAAAVVTQQYTTKHLAVPHKISTYDSGAAYAFPVEEEPPEEFDNGGEFPTGNHIPLLCHFSLRHGFKETKFSITAASEALSAECMPAWTMMTLSHEIMHSRVRDIFQALFGTTWQDDDAADRWDEFYNDFAAWYLAQQAQTPPLAQGIRNAILNFCLATERELPVKTRRLDSEHDINPDDVLNAFRKHKRLASEFFVHFHDYYFAYARQPRLYVMSLWASWPTVAAPAARPSEYLVRTLATIACGTGAAPRAAFDGATDILLDALDALEATGIRSPLYEEIRSLLRPSAVEATFAFFKPAYYLIDQVRRYFASRIIAKRIDRLETDPFAEGSTVAEEYSASIYVHGEQGGTQVSPIRYSLAALVRQLFGVPVITDPQWLTAWNSMVIAS
jgi:hypothetical protein